MTCTMFAMQNVSTVEATGESESVCVHCVCVTRRMTCTMFAMQNVSTVEVTGESECVCVCVYCVCDQTYDMYNVCHAECLDSGSHRGLRVSVCVCVCVIRHMTCTMFDIQNVSTVEATGDSESECVCVCV